MNNEELQCMWFVKGAWGAVCRQISFLIFDFVWEQGLMFKRYTVRRESEGKTTKIQRKYRYRRYDVQNAGT